MAALYIFGTFELDEARFALCQLGTVVAVQPKVLKMLLHLVRHRDRVVGTEELFRVLWPEEHVGMASIKRAVIGVRRALGEPGDSQASVRTVRGFGYQFAAQVRVDTSAVVALADAPLDGGEVADEPCAGPLSALSIEARPHLEAASVLGLEFSISLLAELASSSIEQVFPSLCAAVTAQLLGQVKEAAGRYRFLQEGVRNDLYESLAPTQRARLHGQAARALEARGPGLSGAQLLELAEHYFRAAPTHDQGRALDYSLRLARSERPRLAAPQVATLLAQAFELLELGEPSGAERMELLLELGIAQRKAIHFASARESLLAASEIAEALGRYDVLTRVAELLSVPVEAGEVDAVQVRLLREARVRVGVGDPRAPLLDALLARALCYVGNLDERAQLAESAYAATPVLPPTERAAVLEHCHEAFSEPEQLPLRLAISEQLGRLAQRLNDPVLAMRGCTCQIRDALEQGDLESVDAALATLELTSERSQDLTFGWYGRAYRSVRAYIAGEFTLAERLADEALALNAMAANAEHVHAAQVIGVWLLSGKLAECEVLMREMSARYPRLSGWRAVLGSVQLATGRPALAQRALHQLLDEDLLSLRGDPFVLSALTPCADLCAQLGDQTAARLLYEAILPHARLHSLVHMGMASWGSTERHLGMLAACMNQLDRAVVHFDAALASARRMPSPTFTSLTELSYGRTLLELGNQSDRAHAASLLDSARVIAERHAFHGVAAQARTLLAACGTVSMHPARVTVLRTDRRRTAR
ncbi:MAG: hypothetical protein RLZZ450_4888 [Pseudomonadota bacterium]